MLLWQENESLRRDRGDAVSPGDIQDLHNELIACKLREAESNMAAKQLQNELFEIERLWQVRYVKLILYMRQLWCSWRIKCTATIVYTVVEPVIFESFDF